jgi:BirA family biotin operon repressor/biotin-[acetyl-CoA-carboxylase] ligase
MFDIAEFHRITPKWARLLQHHQQLSSTNDEARRLAECGAVHGTVVLADHQLTGRGRRGAVWASEPGDGLLFSLILRPDFPRKYWSRLALASGLGIVNALRDGWGLAAEIKWPNDVYIDGKKCAGILVESQDGFAVVGVGLNVASSPDGGDSTSLREQLGEAVSREQVLGAVLDGLLNESRFCADGFPGQLSRMRPLCWLSGKEVSFRSNQDQVSGRVLGIGDEGELVVQIDGEARSFQQAELIRVMPPDRS